MRLINTEAAHIFSINVSYYWIDIIGFSFSVFLNLISGFILSLT